MPTIAASTVSDHCLGARPASWALTRHTQSATPAAGPSTAIGVAHVGVILYVVLYPQADVSRVIAYGVAGTAILFGWHFYARRTHAQPAAVRTMVAVTAGALAMSSIMMALIGNQLGGLSSTYLH